MSKLTVACVLNSQANSRKGGYDISWVDKLYRAVTRNLNIDFQFVCLSNVPTSYDTIPLISESDIYWNKIELFRKDLFLGPVLYLDLDVIICKNITHDIKSLPSSRLLMIQEPYRDIINSSVMYWQGDYSFLFDNYIKNKDFIVNDYAAPGLRFGDQAYIVEHADVGLIQDHVPSNFIEWRHHKVETPIIDPSILVFTSSQKPSNNLHLDLVQQHWIN
jgi:hypothetical protein